MRPAFDALFNIDEAMADVVAQATQPALGAIKLAWWRERLEDLDRGMVPSEPRLQAVNDELLLRGVSGVELAELEAGWATLFQPQPDSAAVAKRGVTLFSLAGRLLGSSDAVLISAGGLYALQHVGRRHLLAEPLPANILRELAGQISPRALRPLTALAALAARDFRRGAFDEPEATPSRAWTLLRHRLSGRFR